MSILARLYILQFWKLACVRNEWILLEYGMELSVKILKLQSNLKLPNPFGKDSYKLSIT